MKRIFILLCLLVSFSSFADYYEVWVPSPESMIGKRFTDPLVFSYVVTPHCGDQFVVSSSAIYCPPYTYDPNLGFQPAIHFIKNFGNACPEGLTLKDFKCIKPETCDDITKKDVYLNSRNSCFDIGGHFNFSCDDRSGTAVYSMSCEQDPYCSSPAAINQIAGARRLCVLQASGEPYTFTNSCSEQSRSVTTDCIVDRCTSLDCLDDDDDSTGGSGGGGSGGGGSGGGGSGGGGSGGGGSGGGGSGGGGSGGGGSGGGGSGGGGSGSGGSGSGGSGSGDTDDECKIGSADWPQCAPLPCVPTADEPCSPASEGDLSQITIRLDRIGHNQLTQLEVMQQEVLHSDSLNSKTKITNQMLEMINVNQKITSDKFDISILKSQAIYDTLDVMRANDLKGDADIIKELSVSSTTRNKLLRGLNNSLVSIDSKMDTLKPEPEPEPEPEDSGMGKVAVDPVDKTALNDLFSDGQIDKLRNDTFDLEQSLGNVIDSNIASLKSSFVVNVTGGGTSDLGFTISKAGHSIAVANPLNNWVKYYNDIGIVVMLLATMSALVIVCSKN